MSQHIYHILDINLKCISNHRAMHVFFSWPTTLKWWRADQKKARCFYHLFLIDLQYLGSAVHGFMNLFSLELIVIIAYNHLHHSFAIVDWNVLLVILTLDRGTICDQEEDQQHPHFEAALGLLRMISATWFWWMIIPWPSFRRRKNYDLTDEMNMPTRTLFLSASEAIATAWHFRTFLQFYP